MSFAFGVLSFSLEPSKKENVSLGALSKHSDGGRSCHNQHCRQAAWRTQYFQTPQWQTSKVTFCSCTSLKPSSSLFKLLIRQLQHRKAVTLALLKRGTVRHRSLFERDHNSRLKWQALFCSIPVYALSNVLLSFLFVYQLHVPPFVPSLTPTIVLTVSTVLITITHTPKATTAQASPVFQLLVLNLM